MKKLILAAAAVLLTGTSLSFAAMPAVDLGNLLTADVVGLQLVRNGGDDRGGDDHGDGNSGHGRGHGGDDDGDDDDDRGGDDDNDDDDDRGGGSGRDKPRVPGGSGCDDAGDIAEHAECRP